MKRLKSFTKYIAILLLIVLATGCSGLVACKDKEPEKKGIIILTALLSGSLMYADTGEPLWDPFTDELLELEYFLKEDNTFALDMKKLGPAVNDLIHNQKLLDSLNAKEDGIMDLLTLDADGNSSNKVAVATMDSEYCQKYGLFGLYKEYYNVLNERYGEDYEVSVFNYDWRIDNRINADRLEAFIAENEYDKIVLTAHSMGGNVVANYLAKSQSNRDKVEAFFSFGSPYLGAQMALTTLEDLDSFKNIFDSLGSDSSLGLVLNSIPALKNVKEKIVPMAESWVSLYQLLPTPELLSTSTDDGYCVISVDGKAITTADELYDFYESRFWAKDENGNLRKAVAELRDYHNASYVEVDGKLVHSTTLVNTYYCYGNNLATYASVEYLTDGTEVVWDDYHSKETGDGTVLFQSATAKSQKDNTIELANRCHIYIGLKPEYTQELLCSVIDKFVEESKSGK